jgi:hypothetical protein
MPISERIESTIESWSQKWKDRLSGWLASAIGFGIEVILDRIAKSGAKQLKPLIDSLESKTDIPPELRPMLDELKSPKGEFAAGLASSAGQALTGAALGKIIDYVLRPITFGLSFLPDYHILDPAQLIELGMRRKVDFTEIGRRFHALGLGDNNFEEYLALFQVRLPSEVVSPLWIRDKVKYEKYWDDLRQNGVSEDRIELFKELAHIIPEVQDVIRFAVREVYTPEIAEQFGQFEDYPTLAEGDAGRAGIRPEDFRKYWAAHWDLPSPSQGFDMYHRGLIDEETLKRLLRALDVMPFWRDKLEGIAWDLPNRIETRMMARYGIVDKAFIVDILKKLGLAEEYRDVVADMNIAMGIRSDLATRYSKRWINKDQVKDELVASGLSAQVQDRLYKWIISNVSDERTAPEKDLTKAEIIKGVKKGVITIDEGVAQLMELGYDQEEAYYLLAINLEVLTGSPENLGDFKRLTQLYRAATDKSTERTPEEIMLAEKQVAGKYLVKAPLDPEEVKTRVDTIRRKRRSRELTRDEEISELLKVGIAVSLAHAYADNDDLRLRPEKE